MKRLGILWITLFAIAYAAIVVKPSDVQTEETIWFWAWRSYDLEVTQPDEQRGDLLAFTPDGTVNVLLENVFPVVLKRINENQAFVSGKIDDTYSLYHLTPMQAIHVIELFDQSYIDEFRGYAVYDGYAYYTPEIMPAGSGRFLIADTRRDQYAIFDAAQNTTAPVDLRQWCYRDCVRVSADGRYIRYRVSQNDPMQSSLFSDPGEKALPYQIYEFDTTTDIERLIYEQEAIDFAEGQESPPYGSCTPDQYGDRWHCELILDDGNNPIWVADEKIIVYADGSIEPVNPDWRLRVINNRWYFLDLDRVLREGDCTACAINVFPDGNEEQAFQFQVPPRDEFAFGYDSVEMFSEQHLIPSLSMMPIYALSRSGQLTELGIPACCADPISQDYYDEASGWLVLMNISDDATGTEIWRTRPLERIATVSGNMKPGVRSTFRDYSLVLFESYPEGNPAVVYSYVDEVVYTLGLAEERGYVDAFPGGMLLVDFADENRMNETYAVANDGIYRWTPTEGETLLIDGAISIPSRW